MLNNQERYISDYGFLDNEPSDNKRMTVEDIFQAILVSKTARGKIV
jgi:hypothetical protein